MRHWLAGAILALMALGEASTAQAKWLRADTPNFIVYSDGSEQMLRDYAAVVEDYDGLLRSLFPSERSAKNNRLTIYLVRNAADLRRFRNLPSEAIGFYSASVAGTAAFALRGNDRVAGIDGQEVLLHEYAHHYMLQYFPASYPGWFIEGFAEYLMTAKFKPGTIEFGSYNVNRAAWLVNGSWLPLEKLLTGRPKDFTGERGAMFYAQSWALVHYLLRDQERLKAFQAYLRDLNTGREQSAAFNAAFKVDYRQFERQLHGYIDGRLTFTRRKRDSERTPVAMTITQLPAAADALLLAQARLLIGTEDAFQPALLAAIRRDAAKFPGDPFAMRVAAQAEIEFGDRAAGEAMIDTLLAGDGKRDAWLLYLRGLSQLNAANADPAQAMTYLVKARPFFARAHKIDPNQYQSLYRYAETYAVEGKPPTDNTVEIMLLTHDLAPQVADIALNAANMLVRRRRFDEARVLLDPVAHNPHGGAEADRANAMLSDISRRGKGEAPAPTTASTGK